MRAAMHLEQNVKLVLYHELKELYLFQYKSQHQIQY
jgi:hypothetical protein